LELPLENMNELLTAMPTVLGQMSSRLELDDHRQHQTADTRPEEIKRDPFLWRREQLLLGAQDNVGIRGRSRRQEVGDRDAVVLDELHEPSDRDVAAAVLEERQERRRDARARGDVRKRLALCQADLA